MTFADTGAGDGMDVSRQESARSSAARSVGAPCAGSTTSTGSASSGRSPSTTLLARALYPEGRFEVRRFRPNIVVATGPDQRGFVENDWIGHTIVIGEEVRLRITGPVRAAC